MVVVWSNTTGTCSERTGLTAYVFSYCVTLTRIVASGIVATSAFMRIRSKFLLIADLPISALDQSQGATASTSVLGCRRRCLRVTSDRTGKDWQPSKRLNELIIKCRMPSTFDIYEGTWASSSCPSFCPRLFHVFAINSQIMNPYMCSL